MKNVTVNFTDAYSMTHEAAVVEVAYATKSVTQYESIGMNLTSQENISLMMQYHYWHSAEARDAGALAIPFTAKGSAQTSFSHTVSSVEEVADFEAYCLKHFTDVLLIQEGGSVVAAVV